MKITKLGHCCLLIKEKNLTILTDPGNFTQSQNEIKGIDVILITHEHTDHLHIESLKKVLGNNPQAKVITNKSVVMLLDAEKIAYQIVADTEEITLDGVRIEGLGTIHAEIYKTLPRVENTGYMINNRLFYPGDALYNPQRPVEILALPVCGPWTKTSEVIEYALQVKPTKAFPVHDSLLTEAARAIYYRMPEKTLKEAGIEFVIIKDGAEIEF
jgi:L-ascorbate metabolism protein UlaG (beta-lactamase superfamily)